MTSKVILILSLLVAFAAAKKAGSTVKPKTCDGHVADYTSDTVWSTGCCDTNGCTEIELEFLPAYNSQACASHSDNRPSLIVEDPSFVDGEGTTYCFDLYICGPPGLSHMQLALPDCFASSVSSAGATWKDKDPTTGLPGLGWGEQDEDTARRYCYTVPGDHTQYTNGEITLAFKAGTVFALTSIPGPTECTPPAPPPPPSPPVPPTNNEPDSFCFNDVLYGVLDGTSVDGLGAGTASSQDEPLPLPAGWSIAPPGDATRAALLGSSNDFGTDYVVVSDGTAYHVTTAEAHSTGQTHLTQGRDSTDSVDVYSVTSGLNKRILISMAGSCPASPCVVTKPIVHNGVSYASLDCKCPCSKSLSCQDFAAAVPVGWTIVGAWNSEVAAAFAGNQVNFGTTCLVVSDGSSYNPVDGQLCHATNQLLNVNVGGVGDFYSVASCDQRILVSKVGTEPTYNTNLESAVTGASFEVDGRLYAILDGTDPASTDIGCQDEMWYPLPAGWVLALDEPANHAALVMKQWGTACVVFENGQSYNNLLEPCGEGQLETQDFDGTLGYAVKTCNQRIMITQGDTNTPSTVNLVGDAWLNHGDGFSQQGEALCVYATDPLVEYGAQQVLTFPEPGLSGSAIFAAATATVNVALTEPQGISFSLYMDVEFADGSFLYSLTLDFDPSNGGTLDGLFPLFNGERGGVVGITITLLVRDRTGEVCFSNPMVQVLDVNPCGAGPSGSSFGDPHLITLDGLVYDFQGVGEFWLTTDDVLSVQSRHAPAGQAAITSAFAVHYRDTRISIIRSNDDDAPGATLPSVYINGRKIVDVGSDHAVFSIGDGTFSRSGVFSGTGSDTSPYSGEVKYTLAFPATGHQVVITAYISTFGVGFLRSTVTLPESSRGLTRGLLGNNNGLWTDDLRGANGKLYDVYAHSHSDLYVTVADAWRITQKESLFDYPEPGTNTVTYTDVSFYSSPPTIDMSSDLAAQAAAECGAQGLTDQLFDLCVHDVILTADTAYAQGFQSTQNDLGIAYYEATVAEEEEVVEEEAPWVEENIAPLVLGIVGGILVVGSIIAVVGFFALRKAAEAKPATAKGSSAI